MQNIFFSFAFMGVINGLLLGGWLFARIKDNSSFWSGVLSVFIFLSGSMATAHFLGFQELNYLILGLSYSSLFAVGPSLYFYAINKIYPAFKFRKRHIFNFVLPVLAILLFHLIMQYSLLEVVFYSIFFQFGIYSLFSLTTVLRKSKELTGRNLLRFSLVFFLTNAVMILYYLMG